MQDRCTSASGLRQSRFFTALVWEQADSLERVAGFSCGRNRIRMVVGEGLRIVMLEYWAEEEIDVILRRQVRLRWYVKVGIVICVR